MRDAKSTFDLKAMQAALTAAGLDGWLFCDFHARETLAYEILGLDPRGHFTRRWYCYVPKSGAPRKLVHAIESRALAALPGTTALYHSRATLESALRTLLRGAKTVAMQYSPRNNLPTISLVDAGTVELVRSCGVKVVSSAELVQRLFNTVDAAGFASHVRAGRHVQAIKDDAFKLIFDRVRRRKAITEYDAAQYILARFKAAKLTTDASPIVAANGSAADPHFEPSARNSARFKRGDRVLIDLWAREDMPTGIYYDITWCGFCGERAPEAYRRAFHLAVSARDAAYALIAARLSAKRKIRGYEVDNACRRVIEKAGLGPYFFHRTGHSIGHAVHDSGVNMDGLETRDDRELLPGSLFSIEPGIYRGQIGVRTELNVYVDMRSRPQIAGPVQHALLTM
jgi:Xaa-Pro dipeptidase